MSRVKRFKPVNSLQNNLQDLVNVETLEYLQLQLPLDEDQYNYELGPIRYRMLNKKIKTKDLGMHAARIRLAVLLGQD